MQAAVLTALVALRCLNFKPYRSQFKKRPKSGESIRDIVNPIDYQTRRGDYKDLIRLPAIIGVDVSGVIEAIGEAVTHFQVGDEVYYSPQVLASLVVMLNTTLQRKALLQLSPLMTHVEGSLLAVGRKNRLGLPVRGNLQVGETVLIHAGAGGVGSIAIQLA